MTGGPWPKQSASLTGLPSSSRNSRSAGTSALRSGSMPTNWSPGGRWLAGGVMMPPIIGPRAPCAETSTGATESMSSKIATVVELAKLRLLRTAFFLSGGLHDRRFACRRICIRAALRIHGQSALDGQLHGALNRNVRHASFLVDPAVAVELAFLIHQEVAKLAALIGFEHGRAVFLEQFVDVVLRHHTFHRT